MGSLKGIDVSHWNTITDYNKVKKAGVQFAIVKVNNTSATPDSSLKTHVNGFKSVGIPCNMGYCYCYATNTSKATVAANGFVTLAKQYGIDYMWLDIEDATLTGLKSTLVNIIKTFQNIAVSNGLKFGIYTGFSFYNSYIKPYISQLKGIPFWIARYPRTAETLITDKVPDTKYLPTGLNVSGWQYSSKGLVDGIKGYVDINVWYADTTVTGTAIDITTDHNPFTEPTSNVKLGTLGNDANWVLWYLWRFGKLVDSDGKPDSQLINGTIDKSDVAIIKETQALLGLTADGIVGKVTRSIFKKLA